MTEKPQIRITNKLIFIPPYLSATWAQVQTLRVMGQNDQLTLQVTLADGHTVSIPHLDEATVERAFVEHMRFLEERELAGEQRLPAPVQPTSLEGMMGMPIAFDLGDIEGMSNAVLQHNPGQADAAPLPSDVLNRIATIAQAMGSDLQQMPPFEANCNCLYCQIARALQTGAAAVEQVAIEEVEEEPVSDEELQFRTWDVDQTGDKLYRVTNPLEKAEQYNVFLGEPIGCTCGHKNCDHIQAVLRS
jgi:hypothetical protein